MLHFQLFIGIITEFTQGQTFVCALTVDFLAKFVFLIIQSLKDILLSVGPGLTFFIELWLKVLEVISGLVDELIWLSHSILDLLSDGLLKGCESLVSKLKLFSIIQSHRVDFALELVPQLLEFEFKFRL